QCEEEWANFTPNWLLVRTKRKFSDNEDIVEENPVSIKVMSSYNLQRQSLLDMSLIKLQLCHMLAEPNLCRSVLIANTVRQIQEEMTLDGSWPVMTETLNTNQNPSDRLIATEILCRTSKDCEEEKTFSVVTYDNLHTEEVLEDSLCITSTEEVPVFLPNTFGAWEREDLKKNSDDSKPTDQVFGAFELKSPVATPDPSIDELFSDVDTSYYDLDTMLTGIHGTPKMGPYDLLDSLSSSHSPSSVTSNLSCRSDLNELDHIMEIIVGS
uniref:Cell division cycle associated 4 n=1 Tax=Erpetoichthys calabaricus TaxID=27687 RepID=A0A8C4TIM7_ERPCA